MAFYPSERLIELIEKSDNGELTKEEIFSINQSKE